MVRLLLFLSILAASDSLAQVILTEIMYNPRGSEHTNEFIEIYNASSTDSVFLAGWKIGDQDALDEVISAGSDLWLLPNQYAVVLDPGYFESSTQYDSILPTDALILTIDDNTFGSAGLSNSTAETVFLLNANGDTAAQYTYSLGNPDGFSDEKIQLTNDDSQWNWANSLRIDGTPGGRNTVAMREIDGGLSPGSLHVSPPNLREGMLATIEIVVQNHGLRPIADFSVEFDLLPAESDLGSPAHLGNAKATQPLNVGASTLLSMVTPGLETGRYDLLATLRLPADENALNDSLSIPLTVGWRREIVVLNEIMFDPPSGQPEWVELYNPRTSRLPIREWILEDEAGGKGRVEPQAFIPPRGFRVLAASVELANWYNIPDTAVIVLAKFPTLNNNGDLILLRDFSGAVIDSIVYESDWGRAGRSIEKVWYERANRRRNWLPSTSPAGATPAAFNSVSPREYDLEIGSLRFEPARPHFGASVRMKAAIHNRGRRPVSQYSVSFHYDPTGDENWAAAVELGTLEVNQELPAEDSVLVFWDWPQPPSGRNLILAEVMENNDLIAQNDRTVAELAVGYPPQSVVLNEVYYAPRTGEIEWFELFNRSNLAVDLSEWLWKDREANEVAGFPGGIAALPPGAFAVVSPEGAIVNLAAAALRVTVKRWLALNNDGDDINLWDFTQGIQDSLSFSHHWGGDTGYSLERINPYLATRDSSNWSTCVDITGSTPGRANSIFASLLPSAASIRVSPNPFSPDGDGFNDFAIVQLTLPVETAAVNLKIYDLRGRIIRQLLNNRAVGSKFEVVWNGRDELNRPARTGLYLVYLEAIRANQGVLLSAKTTVVLARVLQ